MPTNKPTPSRHIVAVRPPEPGDISFIDWLPPAPPSYRRTKPYDPEIDTALRRIPGHRAKIQIAGWPFCFEARVVEEPGSPPRVVDLRIYSPSGRDDVPITNADLKSIPLARIAAAAGSGLLTSMHDTNTIPDRMTAPERYTTFAQSAYKQQRGRGRPRKLTDEFLRRIADYAREAHRRGQPIPQYVAACVEPEPSKQARPDTVRWWLAKAREKKFLIPGELTGRPKKTVPQGNTPS